MVLQTIIDFLHLLAAVTWVGGMIYIELVLTPSLKAIDPPQRGKLLGAVAKRFAFFAWGSIIVLFVTGISEPEFRTFFDLSSRGVILTVKYVLFLVMILIGLFITFAIVPKMERLAPKPGEKPSPDFPKVQKQLATLAFINMILGILILFFIELSRNS